MRDAGSNMAANLSTGVYWMYASSMCDHQAYLTMPL